MPNVKPQFIYAKSYSPHRNFISEISTICQTNNRKKYLFICGKKSIFWIKSRSCNSVDRIKNNNGSFVIGTFFCQEWKPIAYPIVVYFLIKYAQVHLFGLLNSWSSVFGRILIFVFKLWGFFLDFQSPVLMAFCKSKLVWETWNILGNF